MLYDNRNNILHASKGLFVSLTHGFYGSWIGSSHDFQLTKLELR